MLCTLGRSADPRRITEARYCRVGTHRLALSARPPADTVTDLAYILREPLRCVRWHPRSINQLEQRPRTFESPSSSLLGRSGPTFENRGCETALVRTRPHHGNPGFGARRNCGNLTVDVDVKSRRRRVEVR